MKLIVLFQISLVLFLFPSFLHPLLFKTSQTSMVHREVDYATRNKWRGGSGGVDAGEKGRADGRQQQSHCQHPPSPKGEGDGYTRGTPQAAAVHEYTVITLYVDWME